MMILGYDQGYEDAKNDLLALLAKRGRALSRFHYPDSDAWVIIMLAWLGVDPELKPIADTGIKAGTGEKEKHGTGGDLLQGR